jgi:hypothetical protein
MENINQKKKKMISMILGHDGHNWILSNDMIVLSAATLNELDKKLESALQPQWQKEPIKVFMASDNEMIPEWIRPYMNHYFNRILELPLRY